MNFGLLGTSLGYSFSPAYFSDKFLKLGLKGYQYKTYEIDKLNRQVLNDLILKEKLIGLNITIPYKETILPLLDELSKEAALIGAVNTIDINWINEETYILKGHNTDWIGFLKSIRPFLTVHHQKALILGTGGASKAIAFALKSLGIEYYFVSRNTETQPSNQITYSQLNPFVIQNYKLIINTTPLGTFPNINNSPEIPYELLGEEHLCCDLVYNPDVTLFMEKSKKYGASVISGLSMLQFQADEAWTIWSNKKGHSD
jgi:shikimate dehydrogenase